MTRLLIIFLRPLSILYGIMIAARNFLYDRGLLTPKTLPGHVISIGNIAVGGTGKSPIVIDLAKQLIREGHRPAIVTRGYRSGLGSHEWQVLLQGQVVAGTSRSGVLADEAMMQSLALPNVPIIVGARRGAAVDQFILANDQQKKRETAITHWILDDGFQHRSIKRDDDLVLLDARNPSGPLLPEGRFREGLKSLRRASMIVLTKADSVAQIEATENLLRTYSIDCPVRVATFETQSLVQAAGPAVGSLNAIANWGAIVGIAKPKDFLVSLQLVKLFPSKVITVADHGQISDRCLKDLAENTDAIVMTEKDWARLRERWTHVGVPVFVLPIKVSWSSPGESSHSDCGS